MTRVRCVVQILVAGEPPNQFVAVLRQKFSLNAVQARADLATANHLVTGSEEKCDSAWRGGWETRRENFDGGVTEISCMGGARAYISPVLLGERSGEAAFRPPLSS